MGQHEISLDNVKLRTEIRTWAIFILLIVSESKSSRSEQLIQKLK